MSASTIHAIRVLRQRGPKQFLKDGLVSATETYLTPPVMNWFQRRKLEMENLETIARQDGLMFEYYDDPETFTLSLPTTVNGYPPDVREYMENTYASEISVKPPYVCETQDVDLVGPDALPISDNGFIFENVLQSDRRLSTSGLISLAQGQLPVKNRYRTSRSIKQIDTALSLVGPWNYNYTHWFQDYLGRLEGLEYYRNQTDIDPKLIIPADASDWMLDALRAMGYGSEWWVSWSGGRVTVDTFITSAVRRENRDPDLSRRLLYSPTEFQWIRDRILNNIGFEQTRPHAERIFISRENATVRRLRNENELMDLLSEWGFERYHPENMSFAEQVTLFSEAEAIISTHGSGLLNQIWADNATVIEIFGPKHSITDPAIEYYIADLFDHNYGCVQGDTVGVDTQVEIDDVELLLKMMLKN